MADKKMHVATVDTAFRELADSQRTLNKNELMARQASLMGPRGRFSEFAAALARQRSRASAFKELKSVADPSRRHEAERAAAFLLSSERDAADNPFADTGRKGLCCVVY